MNSFQGCECHLWSEGLLSFFIFRICCSSVLHLCKLPALGFWIVCWTKTKSFLIKKKQKTALKMDRFMDNENDRWLQFHLHSDSWHQTVPQLTNVKKEQRIMSLFVTVKHHLQTVEPRVWALWQNKLLDFPRCDYIACLWDEWWQLCTVPWRRSELMAIEMGLIDLRFTGSDTRDRLVWASGQNGSVWGQLASTGSE